MNLILGFSILLAFGVLFVQLCKIDRHHPVHLIAVLLLLFGVLMFYGYMFEPSLVGIDWLKAGTAAFLVGVAMWFLADRRRI